MPQKSDATIVLDPVEFIPTRVQVGLDELGINIVDEDWGDSEHELFLIQQEKGEIPADHHPPNRTVTLKLRARETGALSLAEVVERLQMKAGRIQEEGGWVKRVPDSRGGFSTPVGFLVHSIAFGGLHGWMMSHRQNANEITMILTTGPYCYGTKEIESGEFKGSEVRRLEYEIANIKGTAPGLIRIRVKNEGAKNWLGCISALQSRDHVAGATAELAYEAEALTLLGSAAKATRTGASFEATNNVVKSGSLTNSYQAILSSKISATGKHLTHIGPRRILFRVWDPNSSLENVRLRLEWRVLGATRWIVNESQKTYLASNFSYVDFGEVRPEQAVLGEQRWEFRIVAKTEGTIGEEVQLDMCYVLPTEQYCIVQEYLESLEGGAAVWEDTFQQAAGALTGKVAPVGGTYEVGALAGTDFEIASSRVKRKVKGTGRIVLAGTSTAAYTVLTGKMKTPENESMRSKLSQGFVVRYVNATNYLKVYLIRDHYLVGNGSGITDHESCKLKVVKVVAGVETSLITSSSFGNWFETEWKITVNTEGEVIVEVNGYTFNVYDEVLKTGKALASGKMGLYDVLEASATEEPERFWESIRATTAIVGEAEVKVAVCYAGRSMEFRSDGVYRQHPTDEIWSRLTPLGFLPYAPPSGLEARPLKGILIPSQGNFADVADENKVKVSAKVFYFPGYHFVSEAS